MKHLECFKLRSDISLLEQHNHNYALLVTNKKLIRIISIKECSVEKSITLDILGEATTAIASHPTADIMAIANGTTIYILNTTNNDIIQTIITDQGIIEKLLFIENSSYLLSGTKNGRVLQYRYEGRSHITRLCSFPYSKTTYKKRIHNNYVSALAYNQEYIACSGYGGAVSFIKLNSHTRRFTIEHSRAKVTAIAFLEESRVAFVNTEGTIFISNIRENAAVKEIKTTQRDMQQIIPLPQTPYILITTHSQELILFDTKRYKVVTYNLLQLSNKRQHLFLHKNMLIYSLIDGALLKTILTQEDDLLTCLQTEGLLEAFKLLEQNPMLKESSTAKELQMLYKKLYSDTFLELLKSHQKEIIDRIEPFCFLKEKKNDAKNLLLAYGNYHKLQSFYKEHKYALAYALCEKFPLLQNTPEYQKMQEHYKKCFTLAQKQLLLQQPHKAKELLEPFATVSSKRAMTQLLLRQNNEFLAFLKAISQKEYDTVANLVKKNPTFLEIPSYIALIEETKTYLDDIRNLIDEGSVQAAVSLIKKVETISIIREELDRLYVRAQEANKLLSYYEKNNFVQCYETVDKNAELESMQLAQLLERHWNKIIDRCEFYALQGDIKAVRDTLGELIYIHTRSDKIGDLLRLSFHSKITQEMNLHNYKRAESLIYSYIDIFGMDSELKQLMRTFEKYSHTTLAITFNQQKHKDRNSWRYSEIFTL